METLNKVCKMGLIIIIIVPSFLVGYSFHANGHFLNEFVKVDFLANLNGVPSNLLGINNPDEQHGVICGYIEGRKDAISGKKPVSYCFPESTHYGYCHGYADHSDMDLKTCRHVSVENAMQIYD